MRVVKGVAVVTVVSIDLSIDSSDTKDCRVSCNRSVSSYSSYINELSDTTDANDRNDCNVISERSDSIYRSDCVNSGDIF